VLPPWLLGGAVDKTNDVLKSRYSILSHRPCKVRPIPSIRPSIKSWTTPASFQKILSFSLEFSLLTVSQTPHSTLLMDNLDWGSFLNYEAGTEGWTEDVSAILPHLPGSQAAFPEFSTNLATSNAADAQEAEILLELESIRLKQRAIDLQRQLLQIRTKPQLNQIEPENTVSNGNQNALVDPIPETSPLPGWQSTPSGAENAVTRAPLLPFHFTNGIPICLPEDSFAVATPTNMRDSTGTTPFENMEMVVLPSDISNSPLESSNDLNFVDHNSGSTNGDDGGIRSGES